MLARKLAMNDIYEGAGLYYQATTDTESYGVQDKTWSQTLTYSASIV